MINKKVLVLVSLLFVFVVSLGVVCASDNVTADDGDVLAEADGDVLADAGDVQTEIANIKMESDYRIFADLRTTAGNPVSNVTVSYSYQNVSGDVLTDNQGGFAFAAKENSKIVMAFKGTPGFLPCNYTLSVGDFNPVIKNSTFDIKDGYQFSAKAVDTAAGEKGRYFNVALKDSDGMPISGANVVFNVNGVLHNVTTDVNGFAALQLNMNKAGTYLCIVSFAGDETHQPVVVNSKVKLAKKAFAIKAASKKFSVKTKVKKYTVTVKTGNKYLKAGKKIVLNVGKRNYVAKTSKAGKATFKINKLTKKGRYTARIKFAGDKTYKARTVKVKITVK